MSDRIDGVRSTAQRVPVAFPFFFVSGAVDSYICFFLGGGGNQDPGKMGYTYILRYMLLRPRRGGVDLYYGHCAVDSHGTDLCSFFAGLAVFCFLS